MQISTLTFNNYKQHRKVCFELRPGVNGIVGSNGSGKSNLIRGIQFLLTGTFPRSSGSDGTVAMARNITWGEETGQLACEFIHNGIKGTIERSLHTSRCRLTYGKDVKLTKSADVNEFINSMMGTSSKVIGNYVFTHQNATSAVLNAKSTDRAAMFSVLFGTERCEKHREMLSAELNSQAPSNLSFSASMLRDTVGQTNARLKEIVAGQAAIVARMQQVDEPTERARLISAKANADTFYHPNTGHAATQQMLLQLQTQLTQYQGSLDTLVATQHAQRQQVETHEKDLVHHQVMVKQAYQASQVRMRRTALTGRISELVQTAKNLENNPPASLPNTDEQVATYQQQLEAVRSEMDGLQHLTRNLSGGSGRCPTCGTYHVTDAQGQLKALNVILEDAKKRIAEIEPWTIQTKQWIKAQETLKRQTEQEHLQWNQRRQQVTMSLEAAQSNLNDLPDVPAVDDQVSQTFIRNHLQAKEQLAETTKQVDATTQHLNYLRTQHEHQTQRLSQLMAIQLVDYSETEKRLKEWDEQRGELMKLNGQKVELESSILKCQEQLAKLEQAEQKSEAVRRYRDVLSSVIGVFHRDNYPAAVARLHFKTINHAWNATLKLLGQPYQAQILQDLTVQLQFPEGVAEFFEASGGQQCCAAIAYLWAANQQFASGAGMMFLDEPTNGIDSDHMPMVADMLLHMQRAAINSNLQVVVVTHDERLMRGCTHVVQLSES